MAGQTRDPLGLTGFILDGKLLVEGAIGEGGAAVVYRARHTTNGTLVAVKFLVTLGELSDEERAAAIEEFVREGQLIASLSTRSSAIVQARDVGVLERPNQTPLPYLVLEWLDGRTLDEVLIAETTAKQAPRSLQEAVKLIEPIAGALAIAHERGIAHRDVKPENIFVVGSAGETAGARIKLLDFGIAKVMKHRASGIHQTGTLPTAFTPHYGAPEQFSRTYGETGTWSDVFAMALVILEIMRGGRRAFLGDDYLELARQSCNEDKRPTPLSLGLPVSDAVEAVFARALAVQPLHRYQTMGELWSALLGAVDPKSTGFPLTGPSAAAAARRASQPPPPEAPKRSGGSRKIILVALIGALILITAAAVGAGVKMSGSRATSSARSSSAPIDGDGATAQPLETSAAVSSTTVAPTDVLCPTNAAVVPGGRFQMGSSTVSGNGPRHTVFLDTFCLDRTEVTAKEYAKCVELGVCSKPSKDGVDGDVSRCTFGRADVADHPVNCVTFDEASTYCGSRGMRLPTEAEWELAASRGVDAAVPWPTAGRIEERANLDRMDGFDATAPAGTLTRGATKEGVADLIGNVAEWQGDWLAPYTASEAINPRGPSTGVKRAVRGGSWTGFTLDKSTSLPAGTVIDVTQRDALAPDRRSVSVGFRCAKLLAR